MSRLYPRYIDRRGSDLPSSGHARRWGDKAFSFIFFLLVTFLVGMVLGCARPSLRAPATAYELKCSDPYWKGDVRCSAGWYAIPEEPELDSVEEVDY